MRKTIAMFLTLVLTASAMTGCGAAPKNQEVIGDSTTKDANQYFNTYITADPTSFDSSQATDTYAMNMLTNMMEPLLRLEEQEDGSLKTIGAGAETWNTSEDGLTWTFNLRENTWSDGQPVTAQDYVYGIGRVVDPNSAAPYSYIMMPIKNAFGVNAGDIAMDQLGVKALDEKTLEITLEAPTSYFVGLVCHSVMLPQRKDIVEKFGDQYGTEIDKMVYNGPFKGETWVHNNEVVLVKNDQYWDKETVSLEKITYKIIQDENATYSSLENGSLDTATTLTAEWAETFKANANLKHDISVRANVYYQYYNQTDALFANANIRKAFTLGIDREELNNVIYDGQRQPAYGIVPIGVTINETEYRSVAVDPIKKLQEENGDAKALLVKGLEELGMDTDPAKLKVKLSLGGTDQWTKTLAEYIQQAYKQTLGVNLEIEMLDWGVFMTNYYNYDYQIGQMAYGADFNDPLSMLTSLESSQDGFCIGYGNKRIDELLLAATAETDTVKKTAMIQEIEDIFMLQDASVAPLVYSVSNYFTYHYVKELSLSTFDTTGYKYTYTAGRES